jgi:hypothetical protein
MSIGDIFDGVAPAADAQALALMLVAAACEDATAQMLDDLPLLVTALTERAERAA